MSNLDFIQEVSHGLHNKRNYLLDISTGKKIFTKTDYLMYTGNIKDLTLKIDGDFWKNSVNWTNEPEESLYDLMVSRALQLREKYKYLVLLYSGGSDSFTILRIFLENNIPLDEIVMNITEVDQINPMVDLEHSVRILKEMDLRGTKVVINRLNLDIFQNFMKGNWDDFGFNGSIGGYRRAPLPVLMKCGLKYDYPKEDSTAFIVGDWKPVIRKEENGNYTAIFSSEMIFMQYTIYEWFFTSPDLPKLHLKQTHVVKNYFKEHFPNISSIMEGQEAHIRKNINKACRLEYNMDFQFRKKHGIFADIDNDVVNEDSVYVNALRKVNPKAYNVYIDAVIKPYSTNKIIMDPKTDLIKPKGLSFDIGS